MSARKSNLKAAIEEMEAEDRVVIWLGHLPGQVQKVTAIKAAVELAAAWECERREMLRRHDRRRAYQSTAQERFWLFSAASSYCQDPTWECCPAAQVKHELSGLPADAAAWVAYKIAEWLCVRYK